MKHIRWLSLFLLAAFLLSAAHAEEAMVAEANAFTLGGDAAYEDAVVHEALDAALSADLILPAGTREIEAEAFMGDTGFESVILREGTETVGAKAFANSGVKSIFIPASVTSIAKDAFSGCSEGLIVRGYADTEAQTFCAKRGITFQVVDAASAQLDWYEYDALIQHIKSGTDTTAREAWMHRAEDLLMDTGAIVPLYYYNDIYMQKDAVTGAYASLFGTKYFQFASVKGADTLRINLASEPETLDPALNTSVDGACLAVAAFGGLYAYDGKGALTPDFATGYKVSSDGLTYTFTLRSGLKWSDGSALTAKDFEYSWKRAASSALNADYGYLFDVIRGYPDNLAVTASSDGKTLTVKLNAPCPYMLDLAAFPAFFAVKQASVEGAKGDAWASGPNFVCSGPFTLTAWNHDRSMTYAKNPNYWNAGKVKLNSLSFTLSGDEDALFKSYEDGNLDFIDSVPYDKIDQVKDRSDFHTVDNLGTYYMVFNVNSPMFEGKTGEQAAAMRRAVSLLINRRALADSVTGGAQKPANAFVPEGMADGHGGIFKCSDSAYSYPVSASYGGAKLPGYFGFEQDTDEAVSLLKQAGFAFEDGKLSARTPLSFEYLTNEGSGHAAIARQIQKDLAELGITMTIRTTDWNSFQKATGNGGFDAARSGWIADFNDPINMLDMWITDSGNNIAQLGR